MAEIKSTMEMVLKRAAKMAEEAPAASNEESLLKKGMRIGADFLNKNITDLHEELLRQPAEEQLLIRKGIAQTLLRNIVLPRDEELQQSSAVAIKGILSLAQNSGEITSICGELQQLLGQYGQHKEQTIQQLEDALRTQLEQKKMADGQTEKSAINPAMHPQYREELSKMLTSLNSQYSDALSERKTMILSRLCP